MRAWLPWVIVALLAAASVATIRHAVADETVSGINSKLYEAGKAQANLGLNIDDTVWKYLQAEARFAVRQAPQNGHYWGALARVYYLPRSVGQTAVSPDYMAAYEAHRHAVVAQPSSGYAWSALAYASDHLFAQNQLPGGKAALEQALVRAAALGAREPQVLRGVVDLGLANWPVLGAATKQDVQRAVNHLALRHSGDVLFIANQRGALPIVCAEQALALQKVCMALAPNPGG